MLETNGKNEEPQQINRRYEEGPNGDFRAKKLQLTNKSTADGLYSRMERTKERINKLEDGAMGIIQSEKQRENRLRKNE